MIVGANALALLEKINLVPLENVCQNAPATGQVLNLVSYNVQNGIATRHFHQYLTHGWKHLLPYAGRASNLNRIAALLKNYDMAALQEVDGGSMRSSYVNQTQYLSERAKFRWWHCQTNRDLGRLAQHSNGFLSRFRPQEVAEYKLPGMPGRGASVFRFNGGEDSLHVVVLHLALTQSGRLRQIGFLADLVKTMKHVILMGDWNCCSRSPEMDTLLANANLREPTHDLLTFPSWRPKRAIDHILVSLDLEVEDAAVIDYPLSDHLPISTRIRLPASLKLTPV